jgi:hypothetical protein
MFIGHFGIALAAKRVTPRTSLGTLIFSAQFLDLLWPILVLSGIEHVVIAPGITKVSPLNFIDYPISHSLELALMWSVLVGLLYFLLRRAARAALVVGVCVLSHWVLDYISHRPDLPLTLHGYTRVGLGLWNSWPASIAVELAIFAAGVAVYLSATKARDRIGNFGLWSLVGFLVVAWLGSLLAAPPPSARAVAWSAVSMWLLVLWGWWADRHREALSR